MSSPFNVNKFLSLFLSLSISLEIYNANPISEVNNNNDSKKNDSSQVKSIMKISEKKAKENPKYQ
ncbi:hypothetical protein DERP_006286 [Dermatophagoides pteronyssinus]|uniref:Uncharacterized protein n=1 Tax=Dermatophagoides pteronyssinus TaxID=6956 RepID=A0ABQ8IY38_DERPT|nr:hypothetical protein DERP_006286 [Dermatophagoides pteronyssinus]